MVEHLDANKDVFEHQSDATINQDDPVSGTKYEWKDADGNPLGTQKNVRIITFTIKCTWTSQPTPLELHITIDGRPIICYRTNPESETVYYPNNFEYGSENIGLGGSYGLNYALPFLLEGRKVKIEVEITGGTVSNIFARIKWAKNS